MKIIKFVVGLVACVFLLSSISCSKSTDSARPPVGLEGQWKFLGYILQNGDTAKISSDNDCRECLTLTITNSDSTNYTGRVASNPFIGQHVKFKGNQIIMPPFVSDLPYFGKELENYLTGVMYPSTWEVANLHLKLSSKRLTDTLIFKLNP